MFTLTYVDLEYEIRISVGIWINNRNKMIVLPSFQLATRLYSQNTNESSFMNELWHINLYMNIGIVLVDRGSNCNDPGWPKYL